MPVSLVCVQTSLPEYCLVIIGNVFKCFNVIIYQDDSMMITRVEKGLVLMRQGVAGLAGDLLTGWL
jgi:hypothetical protein